MRLSRDQAFAVEDVKDWLRNSDSQIFRLFGYAGTGKQQPVSCLVQTPEGERRIGDLSVGDFVFGQNGKPTMVLGVYPQGRSMAYKVNFRDGSYTRCGVDHLWSVINRRRETLTLTTGEIIREGVSFPCGLKKFKIPLCSPVQYEERDLPVDPYILGVLIGDGYLGGDVVSFSTPDCDRQISQIVESRLPAGVSMRRNDSAPCPRYTLAFDGSSKLSHPIREGLRGLNLLVGSREKFIPDAYLTAPEKDRLLLLRGLMDTDGTCRKNRCRFSTTSKTLASGLVKLVQSLGGVAILGQQSRRDGLEYSVNVKMQICPFSLDRKAAEWRPSLKNPPSRYIWSIEECGVEDQVCIKVSAEDELYLTDNFIVTHNTTIAKRLGDSTGVNVKFAAFTGKAAKVLTDKGCPATTIHSLIYDVDQNPRTGVIQYRKTDRNMKACDLLIVDEVSMVGQELARDLLSFGKPILVLGDPAQLPPVGDDAGYFTDAKPDVLLENVHRQAAESNILKLATQIRKGAMPSREFYSEDLIITRHDSEQMLFNADTIITGKNLTRESKNREKRNMLGYAGVAPQEGETLICLRNDRDTGLFNGSIVRVGKAPDPRDTILDFEVYDPDMPGTHFPVRVFRQFFESDNAVKTLDWRVLKGTQQFTFGYAITAHKSQGSQWDDVLIYDESRVFREDSYRWLYTSVTRAAKRLTLVLP